MSKRNPSSEIASNNISSGPAPQKSSADSPLSLSRLRQAFAAMLGEQKTSVDGPADNAKHDADSVSAFQPTTPCEINARNVVEAMLFVGQPDNGPTSARELAAAMRGVSPREIDEAVRQLNSLYSADGAAYQIEDSAAGYRLALRDEFRRMRDKFYGRVKEARLSPAALEVLSVLAYNQPATSDRITELRGAPSGAALATLVRRSLVKLARPAASAGPPHYSTTERFLKLFRLESLDALPRAEELETA